MARSSKRTSRPAHWANIDDYLASLPADKTLLVAEASSQAIRLAAPDAEEGFSYGLPAFRLGGRPLVGFAGAANHCSLYPMSPAVIRAYADDLGGSRRSKGAIRFVAPAHEARLAC